jgi:cytoskeletal protein CcmA (bactofilin family)
MGHNREAVIQEDTVIKGEIRNCRQIEIRGLVEGELAAESVVVQPSGRFFGTVRTDSADVHGSLQGEVFVKNLISIRSSGSVNGNVHYGQIAMEMGGNLSAQLRNIPPSLVGDMHLEVGRGQSVRITTEDVNAVDPDNTPDELTYTVSKFNYGHVAFGEAMTKPVTKFTQADLNAGKVYFVHDGAPSAQASFLVVVADTDGATSGAPQTVYVTVKNAV